MGLDDGLGHQPAVGVTDIQIYFDVLSGVVEGYFYLQLGRETGRPPA